MFKILLLLTLLFPVSILSQVMPVKCELPLESAPEVRGLRLGMNPVEISKIIKTSLDLSPLKTDILINADPSQNPRLRRVSVDVGVKQYSMPIVIFPGFEGVNSVEMDFYKDKMFRIRIVYNDNFIKWRDDQEFRDNLSEKFNLPQKAWRGETINCQSFVLNAGFSRFDGKGPFIELSDVAISGQVEADARQTYDAGELANEEKKKNFKP